MAFRRIIPGRQRDFGKEFLLKYEEFIEYVKEHLGSYFEPDTTIIVQPVLKNNNTELDGISVLKKNQNISPTLYLNDFYEDYLFGKPLEELLDELYHCFLHPFTDFSFSISEFKQFHLMKDKIVYRLIHYSSNESLLQNVPHQKYLDLAIVYYVMLHADENGNACIMVRNEHMATWNISQDILHKYAVKNTPLLLPAKLQTMEELMQSFLCPSAEAVCTLSETYEDGYKPVPMYILSNQSHLNGAAVILYENVLQDFARSVKDNLYILPSSIHEVIIVPASGCPSRESLELMVKEVNQKEVSPVERLSDHVYFYDRITHTLTI